MGQKIGIVQTRGIGDIIIALPIADFFLECGHEVVWPIDARFVAMFRRVKPGVQFVAVEKSPPDSQDFFLNEPLDLIREHRCARTIILYSFLSGLNICDPRLARSLKFDEYKYAIAGVPFDLKWKLKIERDKEREEALFNSLGIKGDYVLVHDRGSDGEMRIPIPVEIHREFQIVYVDENTDSPFDWLLTIERAAKLYMIDSSLANLVEQLNLSQPKKLFLRSELGFTPVYKNGWQFSSLQQSS
ncbi:hypothetical protein BH20ACI2_BH20ACI2_08240 [soil metagenome]